ncbi:cytochrome P450 [Archangium gephyra]|uniref:cytochrome P450 n=1 Tax=Archangium gephyra TaxID=48 RepID=UPI0035D4E039
MTAAGESAVPNLLSPENLLEPWALYRDLRESDPVHWSEALQSWIITRHEDVAACFRDPRLSADRTQLFVMHQLGEGGMELVKDYVRVTAQAMNMRDGAEHARPRRQANQAFTSQALDNWRPTIARIVDSLLDRVQAQGRMDLAVDLAEPMSSLVMTELFGIPASDRERFLKWAADIVTFFGASAGDVRASAIAANEATANITRYLSEVLQSRRQAPGSDLLSMMLHFHEEGRMSEEEMVANAVVIFNAGQVSTIDQLSNGVYELLTHPEQFQRLLENPALVKPAVEEMLRYVPATPFIHRIVAEDFELRGRKLRRGQLVFLGMAAANRDPAVFSSPDSFDVSREPNKHMTFAFGAHLCIGAGLARRELEAALQALLRRMPGLRLDPERPARPRCTSLVLRGFESMPVRWD